MISSEGTNKSCACWQATCRPITVALPLGALILIDLRDTAMPSIYTNIKHKSNKNKVYSIDFFVYVYYFLFCCQRLTPAMSL